MEVRTRAGNDEAVCKPGVLIFKVDSEVDTGRGPVTVSDSAAASGGCTRRPNVHAELSDAPFKPGETFTDEKAGISVSVVGELRNGSYQVRVTRP